MDRSAPPAPPVPPDRQVRLTLAAFAGDSGSRRAAPAAAAAVLNAWRTPMEPLWAALAAGLADADQGVRDASARVLVTGGEAVRPHAAALLDTIDRGDSIAARYAAVALALLGDARAVPGLAHCVRERMAWLHPSWTDVLTALGGHAAALLPGIRAALPGGGGLLPALAVLGPAAAAAVPELLGLLDTGDAAHACAVLGAVGPDARAAAGALQELATGRRRPSLRRAGQWHGTQDAAWAHWRVTGDPGVALAVIGAAVTRGPGQAMLPYLADLGPLAAAHAGAVRRLLELPGEWSRVEAAHAWWRITGDPAPAAPVLLAALEPLRARRSGPLVRTAVRHVGAVRVPDALPLLEAALTGARRHHDPASEEPLRDDEALIRAARESRDQIR